MNYEFLRTQLLHMENAMRVHRQRLADLVLENPELFPDLIDLTFETHHKLSIKAAWVLELVCEVQPDLLVPHLDVFTSKLRHVTYDSAVRPISKVCSFLAVASTAQKDSSIKTTLKTPHMERMIEASFDWLIGHHKVAAKAYAMETLFHLGKTSSWVLDELQLVIRQHLPYESPAYQSRGSTILKMIAKHQSA